MRIGITSSLIATLLATTATAQIGIGRPKTDTLPGGGLLPAGAVNLTEELVAEFGDPGSGLNDIRGVVRMPNGNYIVSDGPGGGTNLKHYFEFDSAGNFVFAITQPFVAGGSGIGLTEIAWDRKVGDPDSRIWGGRAKALMSYDWQNQVFDAFVNPGQFIGLHGVPGFVGNNVLCTAIADAPEGFQVFVTSDNRQGGSPDPDTSDITYYRMGIPLFDLPVYQPPTPTFFGVLSDFDNGKGGCCYDPINGTIWWSVDDRDNSLNPNASGVRMLEMNLDGTMTGQVIQGVRTIGGRARGCDMYIDANGNQVIAYVASVGSGNDNPLELPTGEDLLIEMYAGFNYGSSCGGSSIGFDTQPFIGNPNWNVTLSDAVSPIGAAILFRGGGVPAGTGPVFPGINNCELLVSLGNFRNMGAPAVVNGEASFNQVLPDDINLIGVEATYQWLLPTGINVLPLDLSDAGTVRVGTNL